MKSLTLIASLFALALADARTAQAQEQDPVRHGRQLAVQFCGRAMRSGTRRQQPAPRRAAVPHARPHLRSRSIRARARRGLLSGHPDMPQFKFDYEDARALRDYLRTIQD